MTQVAQITVPPNDINWLLETAKILIPPFLAAILSGYFISRWQSRESAIESRLDEVSQELKDAADLAADYWRKQPGDPGIPLLESKVLAAITRIDGLRSAIEEYVSRPARDEITQAASAFLREATGGDFGVHNRAADVERARGVVLFAAIFTVAVRRSRMRDLSGWRRRR